MWILEELFCIYEQSSCSKSVDESWKECESKLNIIPDESIEGIRDLIHNYARECEISSFKNGFYSGIALMIEFIYRNDEFSK